MTWLQKRPRGPDANIGFRDGVHTVRVRLKLPDGTEFARDLTARSKTAARSVRDDCYAAYNAQALDILSGTAAERQPPREAAMSLRLLAETCREEWWPARGRSPDVCEQYFQKLRDYVFPVLGEDTPIDRIAAADWGRVLAALQAATTNRGTPMGTGTIRKVKAVLSSALTCAVANKALRDNPIKGLPFDPNPLAEADRLGTGVESMADEESPAKRQLTDAEVAVIHEAFRSSWLYPQIVLQSGFGLRIAEALAVRPDDFDRDFGDLRVRWQVRRRRNPRWAEGGGMPKTVLQRVPVLKSKAGRRDIPTMPDVAGLLGSMRAEAGGTLVHTENGGLVEPRNAQREFRRVVDALIGAGELPRPRPTTHSLRSWRLSHWANVVGMPPSHLMRLAGHANVETTMRYYVRSDSASLRQWLGDRAPAGSPLASPPLPARAR